MFIMCRPTRFIKPPKDEQTNNIHQPCTYCEGMMWVSDKKREMIRLNSSFQLVCMDCIALRENIRDKLGLKESPILDVNKMEGSLTEVIGKCEKIQEDLEKENEDEI
jgi:hypothetical protein